MFERSVKLLPWLVWVFRQGGQRFIQRPQFYAWRGQNRGEQRQVDQSTASSVELPAFDEFHDLADANISGRL
jgi:hypothetical protein